MRARYARMHVLVMNIIATNTRATDSSMVPELFPATAPINGAPRRITFYCRWVLFAEKCTRRLRVLLVVICRRSCLAFVFGVHVPRDSMLGFPLFVMLAIFLSFVVSLRLGCIQVLDANHLAHQCSVQNHSSKRFHEVSETRARRRVAI